MDDNFDLPQNYQNAVDCLVQCEFIISTLQERLTSKNIQIVRLEDALVQNSLELASSKALHDEQSQVASKDRQIVRLEGKLVQNSLELASSKALQDEQSQELNRLKRQISSVTDCVYDSNDKVNDEECAADYQHQQQQVSSKDMSSLLVDFYTPVSITRRNGCRAGAGGGGRRDDSPRRRRPALSQAWSDTINREHQSEVMPWPQQDEETTNETRAHLKPKRRGGFQLSRLTQRVSWGVDGDNTQATASSITLDESQRSQNDSAKGSIFSDTSEIFSNSTANTDSSPSISNKSGQRSWRNNSSLGESLPSRRLSNFGQLLLGLNKNDTTNRKECGSTAAVDVSGGKHSVENEFDGCSRTSSRSLIEGVVFPISSADCLIGLLEEDDVVERSARCLDNANAEWPEFG